MNMDLSFLDQENVIAEFQDLIDLDSVIDCTTIDAIGGETDADVEIQIHKLDASR